MKNGTSFLAAVALLLASACHGSETKINNTPVSESTPQPQPKPDAQETLFTDFLKQEDHVERESQSRLVQAWQRVPDYQLYRIARAADFRIPEWVKRERYWIDVERALDRPYDFGEMSGASGLAAIIIDRRISDPKRFSCVVFIVRPSKRYDGYWIFKDEDLSHFTMGRNSGNVYLSEFRDDGTERSCTLQYSGKQKRWACELYD